MDDGDRQDILIGLFHGHDLVDEGSHRLARGWEDIDHPAIEDGHDRLYAAFQRIDGDAPEVLGAIDEIRMREFLEIDEEIHRREALFRQMAVGIELDADQNIRPDDLTDAREEITLGVLVAIGDHGAVQAKHNTVHRQGGAQLVEDFVAQILVGPAVHQAGRIGPGSGALDQLPALFSGDPASNSDWRGAERRRFRMRARRRIEGGLEGAAIDADRRKSVRFGREHRSKNAQRCRLYSIGFGR